MAVTIGVMIGDADDHRVFQSPLLLQFLQQPGEHIVYQSCFQQGAVGFLPVCFIAIPRIFFQTPPGQDLIVFITEVGRTGDDEIEIHYNRDGSVKELSGEVSYIEAYKKEHGIETDKDFEKAVSVINAYVKEEFDSDSADFEDISRVGLAFTHTEDGKFTIDVAANLVNFSIEKFFS